MKSLFVAVLLVSGVAQAHFVLGQPFSVTKDMGAVSEKIREKSDSGYVQCGEVIENPGTYLCGSISNEPFYRTLIRAAYFIEGTGGPNTKRLYKHNDPLVLRPRVAAFDLKGEDLLRFYNEANKACRADKELCLSAEERDLLENFILPLHGIQRNFVLITFMINDAYPVAAVVGHEILHAQYFSNPKFRGVINRFWDTMSESEKSGIREILGSAIYDSSDELLMKNEFQAYILMPHPEFGLLPEMVAQYRPALLQQLIAAGAPPLTILETVDLKRLAQEAEIKCVTHLGAKLVIHAATQKAEILSNGQSSPTSAVPSERPSTTEVRFTLYESLRVVITPTEGHKAMGHFIGVDGAASPTFRCVWSF